MSHETRENTERTKRTRRFFVCFVISCVSWYALGGEVSRATTQTTPDSTAFVATYCTTCHNDRLKTGGLTLENLGPDVPGHAEIWEKVVRKLRSGEMPPANIRKRPDAQTADAFAGLA